MVHGDLGVDVFPLDKTPRAIDRGPSAAAAEGHDDIVAAQFGASRALRQFVPGVLAEVDRDKAAFAVRHGTLSTQVAQVAAGIDHGLDDPVRKAGLFYTSPSPRD